jgi:hypothetical protein
MVHALTGHGSSQFTDYSRTDDTIRMVALTLYNGDVSITVIEPEINTVVSCTPYSFNLVAAFGKEDLAVFLELCRAQGVEITCHGEDRAPLNCGPALLSLPQTVACKVHSGDNQGQPYHPPYADDPHEDDRAYSVGVSKAHAKPYHSAGHDQQDHSTGSTLFHCNFHTKAGAGGFEPPIHGFKVLSVLKETGGILVVSILEVVASTGPDVDLQHARRLPPHQFEQPLLVSSRYHPLCSQKDTKAMGIDSFGIDASAFRPSANDLVDPVIAQWLSTTSHEERWMIIRTGGKILLEGSLSLRGQECKAVAARLGGVGSEPRVCQMDVLPLEEDDLTTAEPSGGHQENESTISEGQVIAGAGRYETPQEIGGRGRPVTDHDTRRRDSSRQVFVCVLLCI